jgi:hypothetical protein
MRVATRKGRYPRHEIAVAVLLDDDVEPSLELCHRTVIVGRNGAEVKEAGLSSPGAETDLLRSGALIEVATNGVAHALLELIKVFCLREDRRAHGSGRVATLRRILDEEDHFAHDRES